MAVLLQISDTHFGTERPMVAEALLRLAHDQRPDLVVLSGDITQRARSRQFRAARAFVDRIAAPLLALPGNHDIALYNLISRVFRPYADYRKAFGDELEPVHVSPELLVLGVNTTRPWRHKNGEVSREQIERVAARLRQAAPGQLRAVVVHQPVAIVRPSDRRNLLRGSAVAVAEWAAAGCDLVLGGHIHLPYVLALPGLSRPMWAVQAGTAVSWRIRDGVPNSVNLVRWGDDAPRGRCRIERWDHDAEKGVYGCVGHTEVQPSRSAD